jgi:ribonuclease P protein component
MAQSGDTPDEQFPKSERILKRDEYRHAYDQGRKYKAKYFTAFVLPNKLERARLGITATRKVGKSYKRNRARRLIREVFRKNKWRIDQGIDIVINARGIMVDTSYDEIEKDFIGFLEKSK